MLTADEKAGKWTNQKDGSAQPEKNPYTLAERSSGYCMEQSLLGKSRPAKKRYPVIGNDSDRISEKSLQKCLQHVSI